MATIKMILTKVVIEGTPRLVELDTRVEKDGHQQQTHKGVLLEVEPSSQARSEFKECIKPSPGFGWMDKEDSTTFQSALGSMKGEGWMDAWMIKEFVHKSKNKVGCYVGIYRTRVGMQFGYQGMSRIQSSKKVRGEEFGMGDLSSTRGPNGPSLRLGGAPSHLRCVEARGFLPWWSSWELLERFPRGLKRF